MELESKKLIIIVQALKNRTEMTDEVKTDTDRKADKPIPFICMNTVNPTLNARGFLKACSFGPIPE